MNKKKLNGRLKTDITKMTEWLLNVQDLLPGKFTVQLHPVVGPDPKSWLHGQPTPFVRAGDIEFGKLPSEIIGLIDNAQRALSGGRPVLTFAETDHPHLLILHTFGMNGNRKTKEIFSIHVIFKPETASQQLKQPMMLPGGGMVTA